MILVAAFMTVSVYAKIAEMNTPVPEIGDASVYYLTEAAPEDGSVVENLSVIATQWEGPETDWGIDVSNSKEAVIARDADGNQVATGTLRNVPSGIQIRLSETITTPGEYTVTIMPGMVFGAIDIDEDTGMTIPASGTENEETTLHYTVRPAIEPYHLTEATPEDGSVVEQLSVIATQWEGQETDYGIGVSNSKEAVIARDADGNQVATGTLRNVPSGIQIRLSETITTPGEYTVTIMPGMVFGVADMDEDTGETIPTPGTENEETTLRYTVQPAVEPYHLMDATPEDGSVVERLSVISTIWEGPETKWGIDVSSSRDAVIVRDSEGSQVATGTLKRDSQTGVLITLSETIKTDGDYTVTILAGTVFGSDGFDNQTLQSILVPGTENEETVLHYTVKSQNGVGMLINDNDECIYYDLAGKRVSKPEHGIFIRINGQNRDKIAM